VAARDGAKDSSEELFVSTWTAMELLESKLQPGATTRDVARMALERVGHDSNGTRRERPVVSARTEAR
jgi:hypothetical protein